MDVRFCESRNHCREAPIANWVFRHRSSLRASPKRALRETAFPLDKRLTWTSATRKLDHGTWESERVPALSFGFRCDDALYRKHVSRRRSQKRRSVSLVPRPTLRL